MFSGILNLYYSSAAVTYMNGSIEGLCVELVGDDAVGCRECEVNADVCVWYLSKIQFNFKPSCTHLYSN